MKHSVYFDGKVQSLELTSLDGQRATIGVIESGDYSFSTDSEEHITVVEGTVHVRLPGSDWKPVAKGQDFVAPRGCSFDIRTQGGAAYICYYR